MYPLHLLFIVLVVAAVLLAVERRHSVSVHGAMAGACSALALYYHQSTWLLVAIILVTVPWMLRGQAIRFLVPYAALLGCGFSLFVLIHGSFYTKRLPSFARWYTFEWVQDYYRHKHFRSQMIPGAQRLQGYGLDIWCSLVNDQRRNVFTRYHLMRRQDGRPIPINVASYEEIGSPTLRRMLAAIDARLQPLYLVTSGIMALFLATSLSAGVGLLRRGPSYQKLCLTFLALCAALYLAGFGVLDWTGYLYYITWMYIWGIVGLTLPWIQQGTLARSLALLALAALFINNFCSGILPLSCISNHRVMRSIEQARGVLRPTDLMISSGASPEAYYWSYFARCEAFDVTFSFQNREDRQPMEYFMGHVAQALDAGHRVFVTGTTFEHFYTLRGRPDSELGRLLRQNLEARYDLRRAFSTVDFPDVYRVYPRFRADLNKPSHRDGDKSALP